MTISWNDFEKIDIRCGTVLSAKLFEKALKPAFQLEIDFGPLVHQAFVLQTYHFLHNPQSSIYYLTFV